MGQHELEVRTSRGEIVQTGAAAGTARMESTDDLTPLKHDVDAAEQHVQEEESTGAVEAERAALSRRKLLLGIPIVIGIAITWAGATQTGKSTFTPTFNGPFFTIWFSTSFMLLCFPVYLVAKCTIGRAAPKDVFRSGYSVLASYKLSPPTRHTPLHNHEPVYNLRYFLVQSCIVVGPFCLLWMVTNYCYLRALASIAPADVTALFSSAPAFVYIFSHFFLKEPFVLIRPIAVLLAIVGIVLFAYSDGFEAASVQGVLLSVAAAIGAGLYKTLFKRAVGDADIGQVSFFLSTLAALSTFVLWPVVLALAWTGIEHLHDLPWEFLMPNAILGLLFNFLINFGIAFTYPLFISFGTVVGFPVNALADYLFRHVSITEFKLVSAAYILSAFFPHADDSEGIQVCGTRLGHCLLLPLEAVHRRT
eukprot:scpid68923/ scgid24672/ Solute carrier family 35 member F3